MSTPVNHSKFSIKEICILGISSALMFVLQIVMAPLPNIEPVSLFILVLVTLFGWKALLTVAVFVLLEGLLYGFGLWWFFYLYAWPVLCVAAVLLKKVLKDSVFGYSMLSGCFGLAFGFLYVLILFFTGSTFSSVLTAWIAGIPFDIIHGISNFALCFFLYKPLLKIAKKVI